MSNGFSTLEKKEKKSFHIFHVREFGVFVALILIILVFSITAKNFFSAENFLNILRQMSLLGIMAVGMTMVIVVAEIDLSIGAVFGISACISAVLMNNGVPVWLTVAIGLIIGVLFGILNGALVVYAKIPALIVTLGTLNMARGLALIIVKGLPVSIRVSDVKDSQLSNFIFMGQGKIFGVVPVLVIFLLVITFIGYLILSKNIYGFHMRAVGDNPIAAKASGINMAKVKIFAFAVSGLCAAIAGMLNLAFISNIQGTSGSGNELPVIAAVIIGGTKMAGGSGTMIGTLIGVLITGVIRNGLVLLKVSPFWQTFVMGFIIIAAVGVDIWSRKK